MHILLIIAILIFISSTMPVLAKGLTALITFGFLAPIFIIGVGAMSWLAIHAMGGNIDGSTCFLLFGLPAAGLMAWFIYS